MLDTTNGTKAMMERLSRATGTPHTNDKDAKPNPYSAVHWLLENNGPAPARENAPRGYIISIMRNGLILQRQPIGPTDCKTQEQMNELVAAMFAKIQTEKKAA